jgi:hypothetical protein
MQEANPPARERGAESAKPTAWVRVLLRDGDNAASPETETRSSPAQDPAPAPGREAEPSRLSPLLRPSLLVADLLLVILAVWLVFTRHGRMGLAEAALCMAAVTLGAWLACLVFWR